LRFSCLPAFPDGAVEGFAGCKNIVIDLEKPLPIKQEKAFPLYANGSFTEPKGGAH
jgi:hypothetical protein